MKYQVWKHTQSWDGEAFYTTSAPVSNHTSLIRARRYAAVYRQRREGIFRLHRYTVRRQQVNAETLKR